MVAVACFFGFFVVAFLICQAPGNFGAFAVIALFLTGCALFGFGGAVVGVAAFFGVMSYVEHRLKVRETRR